MIRNLAAILMFLTEIYFPAEAKETTCVINGKKSLNVVSERFISFSVDPASLLPGFNISTATTQMAKHLSPAFIRIAGPSTESVQFSDNDTDSNFSPEKETKLTITPLLWMSFNLWIGNANLTPVVAISDKDEENGPWNAKSIIPFLDLNEKMGFPCYWQLGYECGHKSLFKYKHDLMQLKEVLKAYPSSRQVSKIVGSNVRPCFLSEDFTEEDLEDLEGTADAVMWEQVSENRGFVKQNPLSYAGLPVATWLTVPKASHPVTFASALLWAKQIGEAAKAGYEVIFRQPRLYELLNDTPVFWVSLVYKALVGRNVLDVRTNSLPDSDVFVYAHCAKRQSNYSKQGAMTLFVVNNGSHEHTTSLRVASSYPRSIEVQSYVLTCDEKNSANIYLNGEKLVLDALEDKLQFTPKIRRVRTNKLLALISPAMSVAFFVLPSARIPVCISGEDESQLLMHEMHEDQNINFSYSGEDLPEQDRATTPNELYNSVQRQLKVDNEYYKNAIQKKPQENAKLQKETTMTLIRNDGKVGNAQTTKQFSQFLVNRIKLPFRRNMQPPKVEIVFKERPAKIPATPNSVREIEFELTNNEMKKILLDRVKQQAVQQNVDVTSQELEDALREATEKLTAPKDTTQSRQKRKRFINWSTLRRRRNKSMKNRIAKRREKRDINMDLLNERTVEFASNESPFRGTIKNTREMQTIIRTPQKFPQAREELAEATDFILHRSPHRGDFKNIQDIQATLRKPGETSDEEEVEFLRNVEEPSPRRDVLAELADFNRNTAHSGDFSRFMDDDPLDPTSGAKYIDDRIQFLRGPSSGTDSAMDDDSENYRKFHEDVDNFRFVNSNKQRINGSPQSMYRFSSFNRGKISKKAADYLMSNSVRKMYGDGLGTLHKDSANTPDYFNFPFENVNWGSSGYGWRRKRDASNITQANIKNYKKFMAKQLRIMRKARKNSSPGENLENLMKKKLKQHVQQESGEENSLITHDPSNPSSNQRRKPKRIRKLRQKLQNRKNMNERAQQRNKQTVLDSTLEDVDSNALVNSRRKRTLCSAEKDEVYIPRKLSNGIEKHYNPQAVLQEKWKPQDILKMKKTSSYSTEIEDNEFLERVAPVLQRKIRKRKRDVRNAFKDVHSAENEIEDQSYTSLQRLGKFFNSIKDIHPTQEPNPTTEFSNSSNMTTFSLLTEADEITQVVESTTSSDPVVDKINYCTSGFNALLGKRNISTASYQQNGVTEARNNSWNFIDNMIKAVTNFFGNAFREVSSFAS